jgi:hypothetical protein
MDKHASIRDVATAAGVSPSTVSNVINRPNTVAANTRTRVLSVIESLQFQRNEHAARLRLGKPSTRRQPKAKPTANPVCQQEPAPPVPALHLAAAGETPDGLGWQDIPMRQPVLIGRYGQRVGPGLAEGSMPDGSGIWVRFDDGSGRQLLSKDDGYTVVPLPTAAQV